MVHYEIILYKSLIVDDSNDEEMDLDEVNTIHGRTEAEVGVIEEITLINFMCHKHLNLKLGPNINFIVGQNGSTRNDIKSS